MYSLYFSTLGRRTKFLCGSIDSRGVYACNKGESTCCSSARIYTAQLTSFMFSRSSRNIVISAIVPSLLWRNYVWSVKTNSHVHPALPPRHRAVSAADHARVVAVSE